MKMTFLEEGFVWWNFPFVERVYERPSDTQALYNSSTVKR